MSMTAGTERICCEPCRKQKQNCDHVRPVCGRCASARPPKQCSYEASEKRGIPTGYISSLEARVYETEIALYKALSEIRALNSTGTVTASTFVPIPEALIQRRKGNTTKAAKMDEWARLPLSSPEEMERWYRSLSGLPARMGHSQQPDLDPELLRGGTPYPEDSRASQTQEQSEIMPGAYERRKLYAHGGYEPGIPLQDMTHGFPPSKSLYPEYVLMLDAQQPDPRPHSADTGLAIPPFAADGVVQSGMGQPQDPQSSTESAEESSEMNRVQVLADKMSDTYY